MNPVFQRFRHDIGGVLWLALGLFAGLALYSFDPSDPSFNSTGHSLAVKNFCGYFGSFLADLLYQVGGFTAWMLVLGCLRLSIFSFRGREIRLRELRMVWAVLLLITSSSLLALYFPTNYYYGGQIFIGGFLGQMVAKGLVGAFNKMGVGVILWSMALILLVFYTEKSLKEFVQWPLQAMARSFRWIKSFSFQAVRRVVVWSKGLSVSSFWVTAPAAPSDVEVVAAETPKKVLFKVARESAREGEPKESFAATKGLVSSLARQSSQWLKRWPHRSDRPEPSAEESSSEMPSGFIALPEAVVETEEMSQNDKDFVEKPLKKRKVRMATKVQRRIENWELPKLDLMEDPPANRVRIDRSEIEMKAELLVDKLSQFSVGGEIVGVKTGPAVTLFEFKPEASVKISKITELADDLSLALSAESVRIIAPIPGRNVVGIETSNTQRETVYLKDVVAERHFWQGEMKLPVPLGRQADGTPIVVDLRKMPHLLVAGTTGSGKSVFVVSILTGLLFKHSPKTLKLILIDPKQVDLAAFSQLPHLTMPLIREPKKAVGALRWAIAEMEKRYRSMSKFGARGIESFNDIVAALDKEKLASHEEMNAELEENLQQNQMYYYTPQPYVVIVVEEFGDLMAVDKQNVEQAVVRLAQMARACGIHLILAMQSPRKDVVTGLIKTNIPGRISFKVASKMDSRIILDDAGAERLLARGDMLFLAPGVPKPSRHHGPWLSEPEIDDVVKFWTAQGEPEFDELAMKALEGSGGGFDLAGGSGGGDGEEDEDYDERYDEILSWVSSQKAVSASLLQRKFRLGYPRAARMIEIFEAEGVVGPPNGSKPRKVLIESYAEAP